MPTKNSQKNQPIAVGFFMPAITRPVNFCPRSAAFISLMQSVKPDNCWKNGVGAATMLSLHAAP
ncbi:MAG TPA: hypothetical protein DCY50_09500 [Franconibacter helveticus]|nr:hypothetical protein [Franconibacter helveticus]